MSDELGDPTREELRREIDRLRADLAQRTAECDQAIREREEANANARLYRDDRERLAARVEELERRDPLAEMWAALAQYQPIADRDGHGESWARMCEQRTVEAAQAAMRSSPRAAYAAGWACEAVSVLESAGRPQAEGAIAAIRRAKEVQP